MQEAGEYLPTQFVHCPHRQIQRIQISNPAEDLVFLARRLFQDTGIDIADSNKRKVLSLEGARLWSSGTLPRSVILEEELKLVTIYWQIESRYNILLFTIIDLALDYS